MQSKSLVKWAFSSLLILSLAPLAHATREGTVRTVTVTTSPSGITEVVAKSTEAEMPTQLELERLCFTAAIQDYLARVKLQVTLKEFTRDWAILGDPTLVHQSKKAYALSVQGRKSQSFSPRTIKFTLIDPATQQELSAESEVTASLRSEEIREGDLQRQNALSCGLSQGTLRIENAVGIAARF